MAFSFKNITSNVPSLKTITSNFTGIAFGTSVSKSNSANILFSSIGYTNPKLGFVSRGLTKNNFNIINSKLGSLKSGEDINIKTYNYEYTNDVREAMMKINPSLSTHHWEFFNVLPHGITSQDNVKYENIFHPSTDLLININNYKFIYNDTIPVLDGYFNKDGKVVPNIYHVKVTPALFNPLFMVQHIGITPNTPLLNNSKSNNGEIGGIVDTSNCTIKELVNESYKEDSILGLATYRYVDFMYCKDLGKVANNHLITLRRFAYPIGDNIFKYYDESAGDIGRLVTWFGTDDNKLEDILNFQYQASWKELSAKIEEIQSKEDNQNRGPIGMLLNSANPVYNEMQGQGHTGRHNIFGFLGINRNYSADNQEILRNYDNNKVYTPKNTIQDTVMYEGKLTFTHEFTLTFCYKLRAYDNINPRSAFLDLIGNIMNVTYRRGKFWGGARKWIGPPQNVSGWQRANSMINDTWAKGGSILSGLANGTMKLGDVLGMMGNAIQNLIGDAKEALQKIKEGGVKGVASSLTNLIEKTGLDKAALGELKNKLGRPALYAMDSLLKGDNVGLWHVTIGNPKNPIAVMGNLIMTNAQFQTSGPLGLDDFPSEIKVTVTLKHARSRDAVEIGRMFTKGTNGIYYSYLGKGRPGNRSDSKYYNEFNALVNEDKNGNLKDVKSQDANVEVYSESNKTNTYARNIEHYNQRKGTDIIMVENEIA